MEQSQPEIVWGGQAAWKYVCKLTGEDLPLATFYARWKKGLYGDAIQKYGGHLVLIPAKFRERFGLEPGRRAAISIPAASTQL